MRKIRLIYHAQDIYAYEAGSTIPFQFRSPSDEIRIELEAYAHRDEVAVLSSNYDIQIVPSSGYDYSPCYNLGNIQMHPVASPMAKVVSVKPVEPDPKYYHSQAFSGASQAFGKFSFKSAREQYKLTCQHCSKELDKPEDGRIFKGSVFMAKLDDDGKPTGGLVGSSKDADQTIFCVECTRKTLKL